MIIRRAELKDMEQIDRLLFQVHKVHSDGRPDLFRTGNTKKYTDDELSGIIQDDGRPIFVAVDDNDVIAGYAFCIYEQTRSGSSMVERKTLYIDDLCVDEQCRGKHVGTALYRHVLKTAKENGCYHVTLNVWCLNGSAMKFYEKCGLTPLKVTMEQIL